MGPGVPFTRNRNRQIFVCCLRIRDKHTHVNIGKLFLLLGAVISDLHRYVSQIKIKTFIVLLCGAQKVLQEENGPGSKCHVWLQRTSVIRYAFVSVDSSTLRDKSDNISSHTIRFNDLNKRLRNNFIPYAYFINTRPPEYRTGLTVPLCGPNLFNNLWHAAEEVIIWMVCYCFGGNQSIHIVRNCYYG